MKKLLVMLILCIGVVACGNNASGAKKADSNAPEKDCVEVLYFHAKQRCATCIAIEKNTKEAIESAFPEQLKNGTLVFRSIDISEKENEKIADKYEVTWSSLFVCKWKDGKEKYENLTEYAFANARTAPDKFKEGVTEKIREMLQ